MLPQRPLAFLAVLLLTALCTPLFSCTITSGVGPDGQVWNANNEDGPAGCGTFISVFPSTGEGTYGYFTLSYFGPIDENNTSIQGGMNERGLTFDFNAMSQVESFDTGRRTPFPGDDDAIMSHILATMDSVEQVIEFFEKHWFADGFLSAQMHVADRHGRFAIISASGVMLVEKGKPLVSTNFDLAAKADSSNCWRYPIAQKLVSEQPINLVTMTEVSRRTAQTEGSITLYSNVQNLSTGDVWFYPHPNTKPPVKTNIADMLGRGKRVYSFDDLEAIVEDRPIYKRPAFEQVSLDRSVLDRYVGEYRHPMGPKIVVEQRDGALVVLLGSDEASITKLYPESPDTFQAKEEDVRVVFDERQGEKPMTMTIYLNGFRSVTCNKNSG